jgi:hypothetical protein
MPAARVETPFVVHPRGRRAFLVFAAFLMIQQLPVLAIAIPPAVIAIQEGSLGSAAGFVFLLELLVLLVDVPAVLLLWRLLMSGGPFLVAGPDGIWVRGRSWSSEMVRLPWEEIFEIDVRGPWPYGDVRVVSRRHHFVHRFRSVGADRSPDEIGRALILLAEGRVPVRVW